jgi:glycosyltransferase involved in cell wall biosynthesis
MSQINVSVAMCTCNGAQYVAEQVLSILAQTRLPDEVIVFDDASDDDTVSIIETLWRARPGRAPTLHLRRNPQRLGVVRNFESALAACGGDLIALSDQDDRWHPQRLELMTRHFQQDPHLLLLHTNARIIDGEGQDSGHTLFDALQATESELMAIESGRGWEPLLSRNLVTGATAVLRSQLRDVAVPVPAGWLHDEWLGMVAALLGGLRVEPTCLIDYRQHGKNQVGARRATLLELARRAASDRADWHAKVALRARELAARAQLLNPPIPSHVLTSIQEKDAHHAVRAALPAARVARLLPIWNEWRTGRYLRFGRGVQGVLRDVLQPGRDAH